MESVDTVWIVVLLTAVVLFYLLYTRGKKMFSQYIAPLDKKEFSMKDFLPVGFLIMQLTRYKYASQFDRQLRRKLKEIYDPDFTEFYLRVTYAMACTYLCLGILIACMMTAALNGDPAGMAAGLVVGGGLAYQAFYNIRKQSEEKHLQISMDLPDLTNKIIILSGAGLTLRAALIKISKELTSDRPLYQELEHSVAMLDAGATAEDAFDRLNVRCNMPDMRRFVSVILQNMHRGGNDVIGVLQDIGREQWEKRKSASMRAAEEAGTKILFPMMIMLFAVILLTIAPAVMGMNI